MGTIEWWTRAYWNSIRFEATHGWLTEEKLEKVIFLDIDGVLNDEGPGRLKQKINPDFVKNLAMIVEATGADIILSSSWRSDVIQYLAYGDGRNKEDVELLLKLFEENGLTISGCTPDMISGAEARPLEIRNWLAGRPYVTNFVILDDEDFWSWNWLEPNVVQTHQVMESDDPWPEYIYGLKEEHVKQAIRILNDTKSEKEERIYSIETVCKRSKSDLKDKDLKSIVGNKKIAGAWWTDQYTKYTSMEHCYGELLEEPFEKVIFLDIDGVLNDEGEGKEKQAVNPEYVENLAKIVQATRADIILTSSWRNSIVYYLNGRIVNNQEDVELLFSLFAENNLTISGFTPRYFNGAQGRPFEIRTWLANRPDVKRFLILDDDTFWDWNWLESHFVCTKKKGERYQFIRGLTDEYINRAIDVLERTVVSAVKSI